MANNTIYIAAAGAGKTTLILKQAIELYKKGLPNGKKILIITYTDNNQNNIRQKFLSEYGLIPKDIVILGWFTFLLAYWIRPFKGTVIEQLYDRHIGMSFVEGISGTKTLPNGHIITTYHNDAEKFLDSSLKYLYSDKMAEFAYKCWEQNKTDLLNRMSNIADTIFIDEAQDLAAWDFEIIKTLIRSDQIKSIACFMVTQDNVHTKHQPLQNIPNIQETQHYLQKKRLIKKEEDS